MGNIREFIVKALMLAQRRNIKPTVHDILSDWCHFCGHTSHMRINGIQGMDAQQHSYQLPEHNSRTCHRVCCDLLLNTDTLQLGPGTCNCGGEVLRRVTEPVQCEQWWQGLYQYRKDPNFCMMVKAQLWRFFNLMEKLQPCDLALVIISRGKKNFAALMRQPTWKIVEDLWQVIELLNRAHRLGGRWNVPWQPRGKK
jgi:hypothetical protein